MKRKVLIPTKLDPIAREILTQKDYVVVQDPTKTFEELSQLHPDTYAIIVRSEKVTSEVIDIFPNLKVIIRAGSGYDNIDIWYAREKDIVVMNTPGANANAVAEEVIAMILCDARHILKADPSVRTGKWEKNKFMGRELAYKTFGIIGLGNVGRTLAKRLEGFQCKLLGYDPLISAEKAAELNVQLVDLETLFSESDYISLHIPENEQTRGMINEKYLNLMKPGATLVNCARAGIIVEEDLRKIKKEKGIRFLNDVFVEDKEGPKSVADIADVLLPHLGASTFEANWNAAKRAAEELIDYDEKGITSFIVNRGIPEGLDESFCRLANILAKVAKALTASAPLHSLETSFYGELATYSEWLIVPVVTGIWEDLSKNSDYNAVIAYLNEKGIIYNNRKPDDNKKYGNSITIDLTAGDENKNLIKVSVRGTVAENTVMISRINQFSNLYFVPAGHTILVIYHDRPGIIGSMGTILASCDINIEEMRNSLHKETGQALAILKVNKQPSDKILQKIQKNTDSIKVAYFSI